MSSIHCTSKGVWRAQVESHVQLKVGGRGAEGMLSRSLIYPTTTSVWGWATVKSDLLTKFNFNLEVLVESRCWLCSFCLLALCCAPHIYEILCLGFYLISSDDEYFPLMCWGERDGEGSHGCKRSRGQRLVPNCHVYKTTMFMAIEQHHAMSHLYTAPTTVNIFHIRPQIAAFMNNINCS